LYKVYTIKDIFKLPPERFGDDLDIAASEILQNKYEGIIDKDLGLLLAVFNIRDIGDGVILPGDPATRYDVKFDILTYTPEVGEIIIGEISELVEFGAFVRIGPMDGLVHVSQIISDFISYDKKANAFVSKKTGKSLKKGDIVYAKISTISLKKSIRDSKIALTMKPAGLGKEEWITVETKKTKEPKQKGGSEHK
jgi:DNA-directed RNA polymerase subunit E'